MKSMRIITRVTIGLLATLMLSIPALAAPGDIDVDNVTDDNSSNDIVTPGDCRVYPNLNSDSWEATLYYKGEQRGSTLLCGPLTLQNAGGGVAGAGVMNSTKWTDSNGAAPLVVGSSTSDFQRYFPDVPAWTGDAFKNYGTDKVKMSNQILEPIKIRGGCDEYDTIVEMLEKVPTMSEEEIKEKLDSGEYFPFFVSFRPVMLYYRDGVMCDGSGTAASGRSYDYNNREEHYRMYKSTKQGNWWNMVANLSNPSYALSYAPGDYGQPHTWKTSAKVNLWGQQLFEVNYSIYKFELVGGKLPEPDPDPPKYPPLYVEPYEMLAGITTTWTNPPVAKDGNALAEGIKAISIQEFNDTYGSGRVHRGPLDDAQCGSHAHVHPSGCDWVEATEGTEPDEDGNGGSDGTPAHWDHSSEVCERTKRYAEFCHFDYEFKWLENPTGKMNADDLKSQANVLAENTHHTDFYGTNHPGVYNMTRKSGRMDLEFYVEGDLFKTWTWNHSNPENGHQFVKGPAGASSGNISSTTTVSTPKGGSPEPFNKGFKEAFNSHRFGKYKSETPSAAVGESGLLPLAGYMMQNMDNQTYLSWMKDRTLNARVSWILDEPENSPKRDQMFKGDRPDGQSFTWGHGGDWGSDSANSDLDWTQKWTWDRTHVQDGKSSPICPKDGSPPAVNHNDLVSPTHGEGISAETSEGIRTPRAVFGRNIIVKDTLQGKALETLEPNFKFWIRPNKDENDRLTIGVPSTVFEFSPTYKMYADYELDGNRAMESQDPIWMLAADTDRVQFLDLLDFNLIGGETAVRAPWSRDYEDQGATDQNTGAKINIVKAGDAYSVDTATSRLEITATVHYWDLNFWKQQVTTGALPDANKGRPEAEAKATHENEIVQAYMNSIDKMMQDLTDSHFGFYTNLVGGTSTNSDFRKFPTLNQSVFQGKAYTNSVYNTTMKVPEPEYSKYPKLRLIADTIEGYGKKSKRITATDKKAPEGGDQWRLDGNGNTWDAAISSSRDTEWTTAELRKWIPDLNEDSSENLHAVMTAQDWYLEDYEGICVAVIKAYVDIPVIRSSPATVYEKLSDFKSSTNQWAPKLIHPNTQYDKPGYIGKGDIVVIPEKSIGAGTSLGIPTMTVYPGGIDSPSNLTGWSICYKPYFFGVRGSTFDK